MKVIYRNPKTEYALSVLEVISAIYTENAEYRSADGGLKRSCGLLMCDAAGRYWLDPGLTQQECSSIVDGLFSNNAVILQSGYNKHNVYAVTSCRTS